MREKEWLLSIPYRESFTRAGVFGHIGNKATRIDVEIHFTLWMGEWHFRSAMAAERIRHRRQAFYGLGSSVLLKTGRTILN